VSQTSKNEKKTMKMIVNVHGRSSTVIDGEKRWAKNDKGESRSALNGNGMVTGTG